MKVNFLRVCCSSDLTADVIHRRDGHVKEMKSFKAALLVKFSLHLSAGKTPVTPMEVCVTGVIHEAEELINEG